MRKLVGLLVFAILVSACGALRSYFPYDVSWGGPAPQIYAGPQVPQQPAAQQTVMGQTAGATVNGVAAYAQPQPVAQQTAFAPTQEQSCGACAVPALYVQPQAQARVQQPQATTPAENALAAIEGTSPFADVHPNPGLPQAVIGLQRQQLRDHAAIADAQRRISVLEAHNR